MKARTFSIILSLLLLVLLLGVAVAQQRTSPPEWPTATPTVAVTSAPGVTPTMTPPPHWWVPTPTPNPCEMQDCVYLAPVYEAYP